MLDDLVSVIETLQQRIREHGATLRENETRTRMALINPLLTALSWDVSDPAVVTPEYSVSGRWADYALLRPDGAPAATMEAKKLGESLASHRMQMLNYSNASGVEYAGLTDGDHWELYEVFKAARLEERRIVDVSIADMAAHQIALQLLPLWRINMASGQPVVAWDLATIAPAVAAEHKPSLSPVVEPIPNATPPAVSTPAIGWVALSSSNPPKGTPSPTSVQFSDGSTREVKNWCNLVVETVKWLWSNGLLTESNVPVRSSRNGKRFSVNVKPVHGTGKKFHWPVHVAGTPLFIEGHGGVKLHGHTRTLLEHCGIDPSTVQLQTVE